MSKSLKIVLCVVIAAIICIGAFSAFADSSEIIENGNFEQSAVYFVKTAGDLNKNGAVDDADVDILLNILLGKLDAATSADLNGDGTVDVLDYITLKLSIESETANASPVCEEIGKNGSKGLLVDASSNVAYTEDFISLLEPNTAYQLTFDCKTDSNVKITVNGADSSAIVKNSGECSDWTNKTFVIETGATLTANKGAELIISGDGVIDNLSVKKVTGSWTDDDSSEQGADDIF